MRRRLVPTPSIAAAVAALAALALLPAAAAADSRVTATIDGPATAKRGQVALYTVTVRNAGPQTLGLAAPRIEVDLDAFPGDGATVPVDARHVGGIGPWRCARSLCALTPGVRLPVGATATFVFSLRLRRSVTLDVDVRGNNVDFADARKSVRVTGVLRPVAYKLSAGAGALGFTLSEPSRVSVQLDRLGTRYRVGRRVRCADRRPRGGKGRPGRACVMATRALPAVTGVLGVNRVKLPQLPSGRRYRARLRPVTADRRYGREAVTRPFRIQGRGSGATPARGATRP